jgi:ATP-dependent DNA helicase PIF1
MVTNSTSTRFPRREEVDRSNFERMKNLGTESHAYESWDGGSLQDQQAREKMLANFMAPKRIDLRVDAQVMLIKNMDELLVNGSIGKVVRFMDPSVYEAQQENERKSEVTVNKDEGKGKKKAMAKASVCFPVVQFATPKGPVEVLVQPETWKVEEPNGDVTVSRTQLPLILSWAMSIHKSQGQTLERVKVDLGKVFEKGKLVLSIRIKELFTYILV